MSTCFKIHMVQKRVPISLPTLYSSCQLVVQRQPIPPVSPEIFYGYKKKYLFFISSHKNGSMPKYAVLLYSFILNNTPVYNQFLFNSCIVFHQQDVSLFISQFPNYSSLNFQEEAHLSAPSTKLLLLRSILVSFNRV